MIRSSIDLACVGSCRKLLRRPTVRHILSVIGAGQLYHYFVIAFLPLCITHSILSVTRTIILSSIDYYRICLLPWIDGTIWTISAKTWLFVPKHFVQEEHFLFLSLPNTLDSPNAKLLCTLTVYVKGASPFGSSNSSSSAYQKKKRKRGANKFLSRTRPSACPSPPCKKLRRLERGAPGLGRTDTEISFETHKYLLLCANVIKKNVCLIFANTFL